MSADRVEVRLVVDTDRAVADLAAASDAAWRLGAEVDLMIVSTTVAEVLAAGRTDLGVSPIIRSQVAAAVIRAHVEARPDHPAGHVVWHRFFGDTAIEVST